MALVYKLKVSTQSVIDAAKLAASDRKCDCDGVPWPHDVGVEGCVYRAVEDWLDYSDRVYDDRR